MSATNSWRSDRRHVLVIEQETAVLEQLCQLLDEADCTFSCCTTTESALRSAQAAAPDMLIADVAFGQMGGAVLYDQIRTCLGAPKLPVMFLCREQGPDIIRRHHADTGAYYVRKPFDSRAILELTRCTLEQCRAKEPARPRASRSALPAMHDGSRSNRSCSPAKCSPVDG